MSETTAMRRRKSPAATMAYVANGFIIGTGDQISTSHLGPGRWWGKGGEGSEAFVSDTISLK